MKEQINPKVEFKVEFMDIKSLRCVGCLTIPNNITEVTLPNVGDQVIVNGEFGLVQGEVIRRFWDFTENTIIIQLDNVVYFASLR